MCAEVCPRGVFVMKDKKAAITNKDKCIECGACASNCAWNAIGVTPGVGCAAAMFNGLIRFGDVDKGKCGCSTEDDNKKSCC